MITVTLSFLGTDLYFIMNVFSVVFLKQTKTDSLVYTDFSFLTYKYKLPNNLHKLQRNVLSRQIYIVCTDFFIWKDNFGCLSKLES